MGEILSKRASLKGKRTKGGILLEGLFTYPEDCLPAHGRNHHPEASSSDFSRGRYSR